LIEIALVGVSGTGYSVFCRWWFMTRTTAGQPGVPAEPPPGGTMNPVGRPL